MAQNKTKQSATGSSPRAWGQLCWLYHLLLLFRFIPTRVGTTQTGGCGSGQIPVHPHARGDNFSRTWVVWPNFGSSPRAWGQLYLLIPQDIRLRFIPTRVGTTLAPRFSTISRTVHPHARGDNAPIACKQCSLAGSSPRAWGQLTHSVQQLIQCRFIPTRVGTTLPAYRATHHLSVHPHARGDNVFPRTLFLETIRFIPTRVGTTYLGSKKDRRETVHPHARGDNPNEVWHRLARFGSSPRAWGQRPAPASPR